MADVESDPADDKFANVDVESILSRVGRRPLTLNKKRSFYKAPEFTKRLTGEETVNEGTTVQFEAKVCGFPRPVLRWYKEDEEILDHPRIHIDCNGEGVYVFTIENTNKGDEAAYRCRAENEEGVSSSTFYLHVKGKPRSPKRHGKSTKRSVSYPPMFPTIIEKVEEEEKAAVETARSPPSPLTQLYDGLTLQTRHTWPKFLGDWAYADSVGRNGGSLGSDSDSDFGDGHSLESIEHDDVFSEDHERSHDQGSVSASFYVSSNEASPEECSEMVNGDTKTNSVDTVTAENGNKTVPQSNNQAKTASKGKRDMHLPLTNGIVSNAKMALKQKTEDKENLKKTDVKNSLKKKDTSGKKVEERKKLCDKPKDVKKSDEIDKNVKKGEQKDKLVKKSDCKEKDKSVKKDNTCLKKLDLKEEPKQKPKPKDGTKSPAERKTVAKKTDPKDKDKKSDSLKKKTESKDKPKKRSVFSDCPDFITSPSPDSGLSLSPDSIILNPSPCLTFTSNPNPILGSSRPLVVTSTPTRSVPSSCSPGGATNAFQNRPVGGAEEQKLTNDSSEGRSRQDNKDDRLCCYDNVVVAVEASPAGAFPFGRYFEEFIFVVCMFTFLALCIGVPTETFVLVVLGMHFFYSMFTILGLC